MSQKFILIYLSVISTIMLISIIVLAFMQTNYQLNLPRPDIIYVYKNSQLAYSTISDGDESYNKIVEYYNSMTERVVLSQLLDGKMLSINVEEDTDSTGFLNAKKETGIFVEFAYNNPQKMIVYVNGNSKRIDVKGTIFQISNTNEYVKTLVYYRVGDDFVPSDEKGQVLYPLAIECNTHKLYQYIMNL